MKNVALQRIRRWLLAAWENDLESQGFVRAVPKTGGAQIADRPGELRVRY